MSHVPSLHLEFNHRCVCFVLWIRVSGHLAGVPGFRGGLRPGFRCFFLVIQLTSNRWSYFNFSLFNSFHLHNGLRPNYINGSVQYIVLVSIRPNPLTRSLWLKDSRRKKKVRIPEKSHVRCPLRQLWMND